MPTGRNLQLLPFCLSAGSGLTSADFSTKTNPKVGHLQDIVTCLLPPQDSSLRLAPLLRWLGITLVVLLTLQIGVVLSAADWSDEIYQQLLIERLVNQVPDGICRSAAHAHLIAVGPPSNRSSADPDRWSARCRHCWP